MADQDLQNVANEIRLLDPDGTKIGKVLRQTLDQLYDGQHTGRYRWDQLYKTEKTHCGTLVEINLHRAFKFGNGVTMDYQIAGVEVDCKYSQKLGGWMIPPESMGHLCLLVWANDEQSKWSVGIVCIEDTILTGGGNRDRKRTISAVGQRRIHWIFKDADLSPNTLLHLPRQTVNQIMAMPSKQGRVDEIFRVAQGQRIGRGVIATLAQQDDYMKRLRENRGSRSNLRPEGILILGGDYEAPRRIAQRLGLVVPGDGEFVSVRVAPAAPTDNCTVELGGKLWRVATTSDPVVSAPMLRTP